MIESKEMKTWRLILSQTLKLPSLRVDRARWLEKVLSTFADPERVRASIETSPPAAGLEHRTIRHIAGRAFRAHRRGVTALSLVTGLPGGIAVAGAVPADLAQYLWHLIQLTQKLTSLYGWPTLEIPAGGPPDQATGRLLTVLLAQMFGSDRAEDLLRELHGASTAQELPAVALIEEPAYQERVDALEEWLGLTLARDGLTKTLARIVPLIGGIFSGALSYAAFSRMGHRLDDLLADLAAH